MTAPHPLQILHPGDITWSWCSKAWVRTDHLFQPGKNPPLLCLHCHPEADPRKETNQSEEVIE